MRNKTRLAPEWGIMYGKICLPLYKCKLKTFEGNDLEQAFLGGFLRYVLDRTSNLNLREKTKKKRFFRNEIDRFFL